MHKLLQPPDWPRPHGYANGIAARGTMVFVAGQIGWDEAGKLEPGDFVAQFRQTLLNTVAVLNEANATPAHMARMTWYVTDKKSYLAKAREVGAVYREIMGKHYPAMAVVEVTALIEDEALVEIETTAVIPD